MLGNQCRFLAPRLQPPLQYNMRFSIYAIVSLIAVSSAAPFASPPKARQARTASERLGLKWFGGNSTLPKILYDRPSSLFPIHPLTLNSVLYTGGTIAGGSIYGALDDTQYGQLSRTGEQIIAQNPYLLNTTQLAVSNWTTIANGSTGTNDALVMNMTRFAHDALCSADSDIDGAVYTHGTNSLEETAFLMDSLVNCGKPIVGTGSMRPWTHIGFEGNANFYDAVTLAASPESPNRGLMVAFNARIIPGYWVTKEHSTNPDAFGPTAGGDLGIFINSLPVFFNTPSQPTYKHYFDINAVSQYKTFPKLPKVDILYAAREFDGKLVLNAQANGADGVVIAGTGNGGVPSGQDEIDEAMEKGLQVVVGTRSPYGPSSPARTPTFAKSGFVHVIQARIMLQLAIASGMNMNQTIDVFEGGFRKAIGQPWSPMS
jgi:L-asparaginase